MKMFDKFYSDGGKGCASRLAHLRASLGEACLGTNAWVAEALESDVDFKKEVLDKTGIKEFAETWRVRLEAEMTGITFKQLASAESSRTASAVSADGTALDSKSSPVDELPDAFKRLQSHSQEA